MVGVSLLRNSCFIERNTLLRSIKHFLSISCRFVKKKQRLSFSHSMSIINYFDNFIYQTFRSAAFTRSCHGSETAIFISSIIKEARRGADAEILPVESARQSVRSFINKVRTHRLSTAQARDSWCSYKLNYSKGIFRLCCVKP